MIKDIILFSANELDKTAQINKKGGVTMKALGVIVESECLQGKVIMFPGCAVTELFVRGRPDQIQLRIKSEVRENITPIVIFGSHPYEYAGAADFALTVPVQWREVRGKQVPRTRQPGVDNTDVILMDPSLHFRDIQIGLIARGERFYITAQRVYQGWVRIVKDEIRFVPSLPEHAYPGMDYAQVWKGMGEVLTVMGRIVNEVVQALGAALDIPKSTQWNPPQIPETNGWQRGIVEFFNPITNTGRLLGEDGIEYHIGFNTLNEVKGPVKLLAPMSGIYFRPGHQLEGQRYPPVQSIKVA